MKHDKTGGRTPGSLLSEQHSIPLSIALHLVPGLLLVAVYYFLGIRAAAAAGYPSLFGFFLACVVVLVPWELGLILIAGRQTSGKLSLDAALEYREKLPRFKLLLFVFLIFSWALAVVVLLSFLDVAIQEALFAWVPDGFQLYGFTPDKYGPTLFNIATVVNLFSFGICFPLIEELYFRGFLLPRMKSFGRAAPFANAVLFVLYHFWTPWQFVSRLIFVTPMIWLVWKKRSIEIGIWAHCFMNSFGIVLTYLSLMGG